MSALDELSSRHRPRTTMWLARIVAVLILLLAAWALFADLDEVAVASGQVVPQGDVKTVQHLEGGIVEELFVQEGERVSEGQDLLRLALGVTARNPEELRVRMDGLLLKKARLEAESAGRRPEFRLTPLPAVLMLWAQNGGHTRRAVRNLKAPSPF